MALLTFTDRWDVGPLAGLQIDSFGIAAVPALYFKTRCFNVGFCCANNDSFYYEHSGDHIALNVSDFNWMFIAH